jgi:hypothetical protein
MFALLIFSLCPGLGCWKVGRVAAMVVILDNAYSIGHVVSFMPWFKRFDGDQVIILMIKRMMANHSCLRSHLGRIGIV